MGVQEYARKVTRLDKKGREVGGVIIAISLGAVQAAA